MSWKHHPQNALQLDVKNEVIGIPTNTKKIALNNKLW